VQIHHVGYRIRGFYRLAALGQLWEMTPKDPHRRLEMLRFFDRHGLAATRDAFGVSRRTSPILARANSTCSLALGAPGMASYYLVSPRLAASSPEPPTRCATLPAATIAADDENPCNDTSNPENPSLTHRSRPLQPPARCLARLRQRLSARTTPSASVPRCPFSCYINPSAKGTGLIQGVDTRRKACNNTRLRPVG
jgi:hypothetical protein